MTIFFSIVYNFPKLSMDSSCSFPKHRSKVFDAKHARIYITRALCHSLRTSVQTITRCKNRKDNIIEANYRLKVSLRFKMKKEITNQISKYFQIKSHAATFKSAQVKSLNQSNHYVLIGLKYSNLSIFESLPSWTQLCYWYFSDDSTLSIVFVSNSTLNQCAKRRNVQVY